MTGINSLKFISMMLGSAGRSVGKSGSALALSTASFTFRSASLGVTSKLNLMSMALKPCTLVDVISSMPEIELISFSSGRVTSFSMLVGLFPGYAVLTKISGTTISGKASLGTDR